MLQNLEGGTRSKSPKSLSVDAAKVTHSSRDSKIIGTIACS
jgi:hypothetical protein